MQVPLKPIKCNSEIILNTLRLNVLNFMDNMYGITISNSLLQIRDGFGRYSITIDN